MSGIPVKLNDGERQAAIAALYDYRSETTHYLRTEDRDGTHDDCCPKAKAREAFRIERVAALKERLKEIDGALMELEK